MVQFRITLIQQMYKISYHGAVLCWLQQLVCFLLFFTVSLINDLIILNYEQVCLFVTLNTFFACVCVCFFLSLGSYVRDNGDAELEQSEELTEKQINH